MYPSSSSQYKWTSHSNSHSTTPFYPTTSPGPMPGAPQLGTVSLPHPNSTPYHASSSNYQPPFENPTCIVSLNPLLSWTSHGPQFHYNVTKDVYYIQFKQGCSPGLLQQPAVQPVRTRLVLSIPSLPPWSTIEVRNDRGISAYDVLVRIRDVLNRSVSPQEMGAMGVKRIDFLGPNVFFAGMSVSRDGRDRWEVHFVPRA